MSILDTVKFHVSDDIVVEDMEYWNFVDNNNLCWLDNICKDNICYTDADNVKAGTRDDILDIVHFLLLPLTPATPGQYHIEANIELVYKLKPLSEVIAELKYNSCSVTSISIGRIHN